MPRFWILNYTLEVFALIKNVPDLGGEFVVFHRIAPVQDLACNSAPLLRVHQFQPALSISPFLKQISAMKS
jgi:hypothetical protein